MKQRYLACWINPRTGMEGLGTENQVFFRYANVQNVIKFGLSKPALKPGQYNIYSWPEGGSISNNSVRAYKRV